MMLIPYQMLRRGINLLDLLTWVRSKSKVLYIIILEIAIPDETMQNYCSGEIGQVSHWLIKNHRKRPATESTGFEQARQSYEKAKFMKPDESEIGSVLDDF